MINKITGYSGFRSYGQIEYPTQKQGKDLQRQNKIWQSTIRQSDKTDPLKNFHYHKTLYKQSYLQNTNPGDYHPEHVPKGGKTSLNFDSNNVTKAYDKEQIQKITGGNPKTNLLQSGTEHWKSNYQNQMNLSLSKTQTNNWNAQLRNQSTGKSGFNGANPINSTSQMSATTGFNGQTPVDAKTNSYKNRAYINNCKTGITQYKFSIGQTIGSKPTDLLDKYSSKQPLLDNPLRKGTNQMWTQIPGYQGFKPSEIPIEVLKQKLDERNSVNKGNPKINLTENYHVNVPGYSGFKPKYSDLSDKLRTSCLSYK